MAGEDRADDEIIIEVTSWGGALAVAAIDARSLIEVRFQAPADADSAAIERLARAKLAFVQGKRQAGAQGKPQAGPASRAAVGLEGRGRFI